MKIRKLGNLTVSAIGMGCMGFTHAYGDMPDEKDGIKAVHAAFDLGCNFFDTAEMYSYFKNEEFENIKIDWNNTGDGISIDQLPNQFE